MLKYLELAVAMELNRGDWSNGYSYVRKAIYWFEIENKLDQIIYDELVDIIENSDCIDGRHFRDCRHNYNWIMDNLVGKTEEEINKVAEDEYLIHLNQQAKEVTKNEI